MVKLKDILKLTARECAIMHVLNCNLDISCVFEKRSVQKLLQLKLIKLVNGDNNEYVITDAGRKSLITDLIIIYPMHSKGNVQSYDKVMKTISNEALNALVCSMMQSRVFERLPVETLRVLGQHFLDVRIYFKFGRQLCSRYFTHFKKSVDFFNKKDHDDTKTRTKSKNLHRL